MAYQKVTYYDLKKSPFRTTIEINDNNYTFYFSTELHHIKFDNKVLDFVQKEKEKFEYDYGCNVVDDLIFYIRYYKLVEKRGMYIEDDINELVIDKTYDLEFNITLGN